MTTVIALDGLYFQFKHCKNSIKNGGDSKIESPPFLYNTIAIEIYSFHSETQIGENKGRLRCFVLIVSCIKNKYFLNILKTNFRKKKTLTFNRTNDTIFTSFI